VFGDLFRDWVESADLREGTDFLSSQIVLQCCFGDGRTVFGVCFRTEGRKDFDYLRTKGVQLDFGWKLVWNRTACL
jgi:hypothetical protein